MNNDAAIHRDSDLVARICDAIKRAQPESIPLAQLGAQFHISPWHLQRLFKRATGITPKQYAADLRLRHFKACLRQGGGITDAIYAAGFGSSSRLYAGAGEKLGMTPTAYKNRGRGMTIYYSAAPCPLGQLLVAATERGLCKLSLGDDAAALIADFEREFAAAERLHDADCVGYYAEKVISWLNGWQPRLDLPLDIRATAFQIKVWRALQEIPIGETRSYSQIAAAIDHPKANRAVANACASNPVALVIPCHRVIRADKSLGGYRWGIERKRHLLEIEKTAASALRD